MNEDSLPAGWVWTRLGEIVDDVMKVNPKETPDIEFIYLDIASIDNSQQKITNPKKYMGENAPSRARQLVKTEDILFSSVRTYLKNIATVNEIYDNQIASTGFCVIRPHNPINKRLIFYLVQTDFFLNPLTQIQRGTSYPAVRESDVLDQVVPLPPFPEQRRIVAKIEELFTKLEASAESLKKTQAQLKRYRKSVVKAACEGKLVPTEAELACAEGRTYEPADVLLARILKERREKSKGAKYKEHAAPDMSGLPMPPEGWVWTRLGEIISDSLIGLLRSVGEQNTSGCDIPYIKMNNVTMDGKVLLDDVVKVQVTDEELDRYNLQEGDILFNTRNSVELVGKTGLIRGYVKKTVFNNNIMRIRMVSEVSSPFAVYQMCSPDFRNRMEMIKRATTNVAAIYAKDLITLPFLLPPLAEQRRIVAEVERRLSVADEVARTVEQSLAQARRLRQSVLKKAFEGRLVAQNPEDEPASVLLERIRQQKQIKEKNNKPTKRKIHG